jgi:serine-type D-Ala-D-Ala carboxypeptidase (penicillin-binding protein 5/6)
MKRNTKFLLFSFVISLPFWVGIDLFSNITEHMFLESQMKAPQILSAQASQQSLEHLLTDAYPLKSKKEYRNTYVQAWAAQSTLIKEDGTQKILFAQNETSPVLIASLTKLMTALVAMKSYDPSHEIAITQDILKVEGETGQLKESDIFTVRDLLYLSLIESSNDAATALTIPLTYPLFIESMNFQAANLGMDTAFFANPTGLDDATANYASTQDLTKLTVYLKNEYPQAFDILSQQQFPLYTTDNTFHHNLINTNELLGYREWPSKILGGKTGWTPTAKQSLVLVVESPDKKGYIVHVILGSDDRFGEMKKLLAWNLRSYQWSR